MLESPIRWSTTLQWLMSHAFRRPESWEARFNEEQSHQRLLQQESNDRYRAVVETAVDAIIIADKSGIVRAFNPAAEIIFGYTAHEVIGQNVRMLMPEPDRSQHDSYLQTYRETKERKIIGIGREVTGRRKDGSTLSLDLSIAEWRDIDGRQCFTGIMRDVTARNQQAAELRQAIATAQTARLDAEAANRAKTNFLATLSHEIRTPLMSISGFTDLLARKGRLSVEQRRYVSLIRTANESLASIVNDILDFSKVEAGQLERQNRPFSLQALIHDTVAIVQPIAARKALRLKWTIDRGIPEWVEGDDSRLRQILLNLLNNAMKFTERGTVTVSATPMLGRDGRDLIQFAVSDTGIGISPEHRERLFKKFSQADGSIGRRFGGTGLGLAISKRLVELMGGSVGVDSEVGKGTTIWFTAPLAAAAAPDAKPKATAAAEDANLCRGRILLVDDIETNREIVTAYLEDSGCDVVQAASGGEALRLLGQSAFDLVLMDIQMPNMDGVTATRLIRQMKAPVRDIPVLAMTGNVLPRQIQSFINAGMNDHIGKPIERKKLYSKLWCCLPRKLAAEPAVLASSPMFNHTRLDELIDSLGPRKVEHTLRMFQKQLGDCFQSDIAQARSEAHDLINAAGVLGFELLLDYALALKDTPDALPVNDALMADCRDTRDAVLEIIETTVLPHLAAPGLRKAG